MREDNKMVMARLHMFQLLRRLRIQQFSEDIDLHYGQLPLLEHIRREPGCTQREAAVRLGVSEPSVATSVKRLERAGMLAREPDAENLRCNRLTLTRRGQELTETLRRRFDELDSRILGGFTDAELGSLCGMLDRMIDTLSEGETMGLGIDEIGKLVERIKAMEDKKKKAVDR